MRKTFTLAVTALLLFSTILLSCRKEAAEQAGTYIQAESFFKRNTDLLKLFNAVNGQLADNGGLNTIIQHLREVDRKQFVAKNISSRYGKAAWDLSIVMKNKNGMYSFATPLINTSGEVTAILLTYRYNASKTGFRIYNRQSLSRNTLPEYGDKAATVFTKATLKGLFTAFEKSNEMQQHFTAKQGARTIINWVCWNYWYSYYDDNNQLIMGVTNPQCSYTVEVTPDEISGDPYSPGGTGNGSGSGSSGDVVEMWTYNTANNAPVVDTLIVNLQIDCLKNAYAKMTSATYTSKITAMLGDIFGTSAKYNLTISEALDLPDNIDGKTYTHVTKETGSINIDLKLNANILPHASQEYIVATMFHEILHAYLRTTGLTGSLEHHNSIANNYFSSFKSSLNNIFPSLSDQDAEALAWGGLYKTDLFQSFSEEEQRDRLLIISQHRVNTKGTKCN